MEREWYARDAHGSALLLGLLLLLWGGVSLPLVPARFDFANYCHMTVGALATIYFLWSRKRPSTRIAVGFGVIAVGQALIVLPWTAVVWCQLGRPWEAFAVPQVAMVSVALVVPRSFWLGVVVVLLFAAESLFASFWAHHVGLGALVPVGEPVVSFCFAALGGALLVLRQKRRQLAQRHIRVQAETEALRRVGPQFTVVREELAAQLPLVADELHRLASAARPEVASTMDRAVARLAAVGGKVGDLVDEERTPGPPGALSAGGHAQPAQSAAERRLLARDAQLGALVFAGIASIIGLAWLPVTLAQLNAMVLLLLVPQIVLSLGIAIHLGITYRQPSERRARWASVTLYVLALPLMSWNQALLLGLHRPYIPLLGHKFLLVCSALVAASRRWLRLAILLATGADALVIYFALHLGQHRDIIPLAEPFITMVFFLVGVAALVMRDQRRVASVRLLRAESESTALHRRARMYLALRDQLNSPLQTLVVGAAQLELQQGPPDLTKLRTGIDRLIALSRTLSAVELPSASQSASVDGEEELAVAPAH